MAEKGGKGEKHKANEFVKKIIQKALEPAGWTCCKAGASIIWIKDKKTGSFRPISHKEDFFKLFDICAVHPRRRTLFIQATIGGDRARQERTKKIADQLHKFNLSTQMLQVWQRAEPDKQAVHVFHFAPGGQQMRTYLYHFKHTDLADHHDHVDQEDANTELIPTEKED